MALSKSIQDFFALQQLRLLNLISLFIFIIVVSRMGFPTEEVMFSSKDSGGYLVVGDWLLGGAETMYARSRPVL